MGDQSPLPQGQPDLFPVDFADEIAGDPRGEGFDLPFEEEAFPFLAKRRLQKGVQFADGFAHPCAPIWKDVP